MRNKVLGLTALFALLACEEGGKSVVAPAPFPPFVLPHAPGPTFDAAGGARGSPQCLDSTTPASGMALAVRVDGSRGRGVAAAASNLTVHKVGTTTAIVPEGSDSNQGRATSLSPAGSFPCRTPARFASSAGRSP